MASPSLVLLDYIGVGVFAVSGAIAAAERRQDIVTFVFFGALTGIGGGTLRDLLIGAPVFWIGTPNYVLTCVAASILVWLGRRRVPGLTMLLWFDAVGLAAYATIGTNKAYALGLNAPVCVVMGVITACFGGILRDTLANQPSVLLRREIYVTAAIFAAVIDAGLLGLGLPVITAAIGGALSGFALRGGALLWGWTLPRFAPS